MARLKSLPSRVSSADQYKVQAAGRNDDVSHSYHAASWRKLAAECKRRDKYRCTDPSCTTPGRGYGGRLIADHIIPRREGGEDALFNLRTLCPPCDNRRHAEKGRG